MAHQFQTPETTFIGDGALEAAADKLCSLGQHALIVTGQSMIRQGHMATLEALLDAHGVAHTRFAGISGEPTDTMVNDGVAAYKDAGCDFIIGFGGGSPLDSAKAIAVLVARGGNIADYMGQSITGLLPPLVAIPSTAGTGSEATPFTIITDTASDVKMLLGGDALMPRLAIVDPLFSREAPQSVTVATGLDALTHAIEAYTSRKAFCESDLFCLSAVGRIFAFLPRAAADGSDLEARTEMALAAYEAGVGIANSSVTVVHGMSRPIGALFHVPHGISNAMLLSACLRYVADGACERFATLGRRIGAATAADDDRTATEKFLAAVQALCDTCAVPTLAQYGIDRDAFFAAMDKMAGDALASGSPANTRKALDKNDLLTIYESLWQ